MTFAVVLAIITGIFIGFRRGFVRSVFKLIATILSIVLSYVLAPLVAGWVITHTMWDDNLQQKLTVQFEQAARQRLQSELEVAASQYGIPVTEEMINAALDTQLSSQQQVDMLQQMDMPEAVRSSLVENSAQNTSGVAARVFYSYVAGCVSKMVVRGIVYIATFLFISVILFLIYWILTLALQMNELGGLNRLAGALFGGVQVLLYVWILFIVVSYTSETAFGVFCTRQIQGNVLLSFLDSHNLLQPMADRIVAAVF